MDRRGSYRLHPAPQCEQRKILREKYRQALKTYILATGALDPLEPGHDFERAYNLAMLAWIEFDQTRVAYQEHLWEHGCA